MEHKTIAVSNQKGGVGKTTTTLNLGVELANTGHRVLVVDADPQGSLTTSLGIRSPDELQVTLKDIMVNGLMNFRNDLIAENKPVEDVNELIVRVIDAPSKKARRNRDYEIR